MLCLTPGVCSTTISDHLYFLHVSKVWSMFHHGSVERAQSKKCNFKSKHNFLAYCVKNIRIRSYSGPHFPAFGLNTERYPISLRIQSECGKIWTRITPNTDIFCTVGIFCCFSSKETCLVNNFCFRLAKWRFIICVDTTFTKKDDCNNSINVTKILKSFSSRKSSDRPSVDQFSKKGYLGRNAKKLDSMQNFVTFQSVQAHWCQNPKKVIIDHLNVNSLRNKFVAVDELIKNKIDVCLIWETKADESFPNQQFKVNG